MARRAILLVGVLAGWVSPAFAGPSPLDFLQSLIGPPARALTGSFRPSKRVAPPKAPLEVADPATELIAVPMPRLRPRTVIAGTPPVGNSALAYAPASEAALAAPLIPPPHLRPFVATPTIGSFVKPAPGSEPPPLPDARAATPVPQPLPAPQPKARVASLSPDLPAPIRPPPAADSIYGVPLARLGVEFSPLSPISEGDCGIETPVAVSGLEGGRVDFTTKAIISADLAEALAGFVAATVQPAAIRNFGNRVSALRIAASYGCRTRDYIKGAKLSEHAFGNAIDISAFKINARWIEVKTSWGSIQPDGVFLKEVRSAACGPFTTVLGPGSDSFHSDHFHLDRAKRRTAGPSRGLFCQ
jgi:hypothetical protein